MFAKTLKVYSSRGLIAALIFHMFHDEKKVDVQSHILTANDLWALELIGARITSLVQDPQNLSKFDHLEVNEFLAVLDTSINFLRNKKGRELKQYTFSLEFDSTIRKASHYRLEIKRCGPEGYVVSGAQIRGLK